MDDTRLAGLLAYVRDLANFVGLYGWTFSISPEQTPTDTWAEIAVEDYNHATIKVGSRFWAAPPETKTQVLLHELLHVPVVRIHEPLQDAVESLLAWIPKGQVPQAKAQLKIHQRAVHRAEEAAVDLYATILAKFAPQWDS